MQRVIRVIERLNGLLGVLSGLATLIITVTVILDVVLRATINAPILGATEFSTLLLLVLVYLGLASVQAGKSNFSVEIVVAILPPGLRRIQELLVTLISAVVIGLLAWYTGREAWSSTLRGEMSFGAITFPVWPARIILSFGLAMLWLQLLCDVYRQMFIKTAMPAGGTAESRGGNR